MLLVKILPRVRPDIKVMSNFILNKIEPVSSYMIPVNPSCRKEAVSSLGGVKMALEHLDAGKGASSRPGGNELQRGQLRDQRPGVAVTRS
ncbi:MAG: hypothetical protein R2751_19265 [Bacteroidales bacterium]